MELSDARITETDLARIIGRLTVMRVARERAPGIYHDGGGLYLQIASQNARSWVLRYMLDGKAREMGLGPVSLIGLQEARARGVEARRLLLDGIDPIDHRRSQRAARKLGDAKAMTFGQCLNAWLVAKADGWLSPRYRRQQRAQMETHAKSLLGLPVAAIDTGLVLKVLEPLWSKKAVTARRVRDNVEAILDYAKARGYRAGDNPARWRGHLDHLLAKPGKVHKVRHRAAMPYAEIAEFVTKLRTCEGRDASALELTILTAARIGEIVGMTRDEVKNRTWTIPGSRMKSGREHRVPLSDAAIEVIERVADRSGVLFPKASDKALTRLRDKLGYGHVSTHGFRSTFRDWAAERTSFPREVAEAALAHVVGDATERAYARGDLFEKRRRLMDAWAEFCGRPYGAGEVVPLRGVSA
jgi:integrase